jgi:sterol desaturase/sphingolipid hydroxylase (fatty acid hydroxylase superfamily)
MDQQPDSSAVLSGAAGSTLSGDSSERAESALKRTLVNLLPPATVAVIILFWAFGPEAWTGNPWSIVVVGLLTTAFIQAMEFVFERHAGWRMNRREFATDAFYVALSYTAISWAARLADAPIAALKASFGITTQWAMQLPFLAQVALVIVVFEFGQYLMHRLMHNWLPFWLTHAPHHHITQLNAMKGYIGNPIELFLISLSVLALFDLPIAAQFCAFNILGAVSGYAHANVRSDPPLFYSFFFTTIRHHSLHHTALSYEDTRCNYANSLILIDRVLGTYREGESSIVGQDERKRLSIREQFLFPFVPLITWMKAKRAGSAPAAS